MDGELFNRFRSLWSDNLMTNGTFDDSTDWDTSASSWSIGGGKASYDGVVGPQFLIGINGNGVVTINKYTRLQFAISNGTARIQIQDGAGRVLIGLANFSAGAHEVYFTPTATQTSGIKIRAFTISGGAFDIDDIVMQEQG